MIARRFQLFPVLLAGLSLPAVASAQLPPSQMYTNQFDLSVTVAVERKGTQIAPTGSGAALIDEVVRLVCDYKFSFSLNKQSESLAGFYQPQGATPWSGWYFWVPAFRGAIGINGETLKIVDVGQGPMIPMVATKKHNPDRWETKSALRVESGKVVPEQASFEEDWIVMKSGPNEARCMADIDKKLDDPNRTNNSSIALFTGAETLVAQRMGQENISARPPPNILSQAPRQGAGAPARAEELVVKASEDSASAYVGVILEEGPVQHQDELGQPQGRTPRPVAPSAARVRADAPARTAVVSGSQVFTAPIWDGKRVDLCLVWGGQCGEPAATEFCKRSGYAKATEWKPAHDIGAQTPTVVLGTGQTCNQPFCDGFASITCSK